ncbi:PREDICTED: myb-like protein Q [Habropoda laboriosa]|uniref:myb-like protein Q n=1 Tax=Habropoda laboriosa TaxID=597456 RepID=UPI00083DE574|nr:PREDICTED: myb-like protein Q [Habropoda laboriosa]
MYYYASKLTAAALSGVDSFGGGEGAAGGGRGAAHGGRVCRCHEVHREQQEQQQQQQQQQQHQSPKRSQQQPPQTARHHSRAPRVNTPTLGPTTSQHVVVEHPRPNHYHRHRTKHKRAEVQASGACEHGQSLNGLLNKKWLLEESRFRSRYDFPRKGLQKHRRPSFDLRVPTSSKGTTAFQPTF